MSVLLHMEAGGEILVAILRGQVTSQDIAPLVPEVERLLQEQGKVRLLCLLHDFQGWHTGPWREDSHFDGKHFAGVIRVALVGYPRREWDMATFCKPFTATEVRYFDEAEYVEAWNWVLSEEPETRWSSPQRPTFDFDEAEYAEPGDGILSMKPNMPGPEAEYASFGAR